MHVKLEKLCVITSEMRLQITKGFFKSFLLNCYLYLFTLKCQFCNISPIIYVLLKSI